MTKRDDLIAAVHAEAKWSMERTEALEAWFEHTQDEAMGIVMGFGESTNLHPQAKEALRHHVDSYMEYVLENPCHDADILADEHGSDEEDACFWVSTTS